MEHVALWVRAEAYTGFCWGILKERDHLEDPGMRTFLVVVLCYSPEASAVRHRRPGKREVRHVSLAP